MPFNILCACTLVELNHSRPNENANRDEYNGKSKHSKSDNSRVIHRGEQIFEGIEQTKSERNNKCQNDLYKFGINIQGIFRKSREIVDELKQGTASLELECQRCHKYLEGGDYKRGANNT